MRTLNKSQDKQSRKQQHILDALVTRRRSCKQYPCPTALEKTLSQEKVNGGNVQKTSYFDSRGLYTNTTYCTPRGFTLISHSSLSTHRSLSPFSSPPRLCHPSTATDRHLKPIPYKNKRKIKSTPHTRKEIKALRFHCLLRR